MNERASYYGRPILKPPIWSELVAWYFFAGGLAGASATLAFAARVRGNHTLARRALAGALAGSAISPILLIADLHDPKRFHHMLRVVKPTSPMSIGTWVLSSFGTAIGTAALGEFFGIAPLAGRAAEPLAAIAGPALSTYTATLLSNTAVPVWHDAHPTLPFVFVGGSAASAGAWAVVTTPVAHCAQARRLLLAGVVLEIAAIERMERRLGPLISEPFRRGKAARFRKLATRLTIGGATLVTAFGAKSRIAAVIGGTLVLAGAACERFSVFHAGVQSARDPKYTVIPQRERLERTAARGSSALANEHPDRDEQERGSGDREPRQQHAHEQ